MQRDDDGQEDIKVEDNRRIEKERFNQLIVIDVFDCLLFILIVSASILAISDERFRKEYATIATIFVSGYLGQIVPKDKRKVHLAPGGVEKRRENIKEYEERYGIAGITEYKKVIELSPEEVNLIITRRSKKEGEII